MDDLRIYNRALTSSEIEHIMSPLDEPTYTCYDEIQDGDETGIDCGGSCDPCVVDPTCSDNIKNGDETGIDCGGSCPACYVEPPKPKTPTGGSGGGGGGGGFNYPKKNITNCTYQWSCTEWGACLYDLQSRTCINHGTCNGTTGKPIEKQICTSQKLIVENNVETGTQELLSPPDNKEGTFYIISSITENNELMLTYVVNNDLLMQSDLPANIIEDYTLESISVELNINLGRSTKLIDYISRFDVEDSSKITRYYKTASLQKKDYELVAKLYSKGRLIGVYTETINLGIQEKNFPFWTVGGAFNLPVND
jgi:hypothetical protein